MKKKILFIPHHPNFRELRIRLAELAGRLAYGDDVFLLDWHSSFGNRGVMARACASMKDFFRLMRVSGYQDFHVVEAPLMHRPLRLAPNFNMFWLNRFIKRQGIDIVVNGSYYLFAFPCKKPYRYVVDLADLPHQGRTPFDRFIDMRLSAEIAGADGVSVSSQGLVSYVAGCYGVTPVFIPNGAHVRRIRKVDLRQIQDIRCRFCLEGKRVISHIGYLGAWVDVNFLVRVFRRVQKNAPETALLVVGDSASLEELRKRYADKNIIFTGPVAPSEVPAYFQVSDLGVLPNKKSLFQDMAFHIKLIEYAAAQKFVVASDLEEIRKMGLPGIKTVSLNEDAWVAALLGLKSASWESGWDAQVDLYDWESIAGRFREFLGGL
jgi:glycosyltransferase involved in cell wall biosynthesis